MLNPEYNFSQLEVYSCLSTELSLDKRKRFRFAHIDGGHDEKTVYHDITYAADRMIEKGIIAIDDYKHVDWPGVTLGVEKFLAYKGKEFEVFADMNRHAAKGRKLYLIKTEVD